MMQAGISNAENEMKWFLEWVHMRPFFEISLDVEEDENSPLFLERNDFVQKRTAGYPLQYIIGNWDFYGEVFQVGEGVLIPRQDTEVLIDAVLEKCGNSHGLSVADLCSGSGCIAVTLAKKLHNSNVTAIEISEKAIGFLIKNAASHNVNISVKYGNVLDEKTAKEFAGSQFDIIVCNPPYLTESDMKNLQKEVTFEPELALFGGRDGLDFYKKITEIWKNSLRKNGMIFYETGAGQHEKVKKILAENGFTNIGTVRDTGGIERVVYGISA